MFMENPSWVFQVENALAGERLILMSPNSRVNLMFCEAGFRPGRGARRLTRPEGRNFRLVGPKGTTFM